MNGPSFSSWRILGVAVVIGIMGDWLLRAAGNPGLNVTLLILAVVAAAVALHRRGGGQLSTESAAWLGVGVLFALVPTWRDAEVLTVVALAAAVIALAQPAYRAGAAWMRSSGVGEQILALVSAGVHGAFGGARAVAAIDWQELRDNSSDRPGMRRAVAVARGAAIATPFIILFGGLFITADAVFARIVGDALRVDLSTLAEHVFLSGFLAWIAAGCMTGFIVGTRVAVVADAMPVGRVLGRTEIVVALGLLAALFAAFVFVQLRYFFGGNELVAVTPTLTYAEYARRGFFELVAVVALILPVLLLADWLLRRERPADERWLRVLAGVLVALVLVVAASALQRMRLYVDAYGLTEERFYATALLLLFVVLLSWFTATVLRGRRATFAFGTVVAVVAAAGVLIAINPDAVIARTNIERAGSADGPEFDIVYATSLSADAVPVLIDRLPSLQPEAQCRIAQRLLSRWPPDEAIPLRTWSWSVARAHAAIGESRNELNTAAARC